MFSSPVVWFAAMTLLVVWATMGTYAKAHPGPHSVTFAAVYGVLTLAVLAAAVYWMWNVATLLAALNP